MTPKLIRESKTFTVNVENDPAVMELVKRVAKLEEKAEKSSQFKTKGKSYLKLTLTYPLFILLAHDQIAELEKGLAKYNKLNKKNEGAILG